MTDNPGRKYDAEKLRFDLIPPECEAAIAAILTFGAIKYDDNNWQKLENYMDRYYAAGRRHGNLRRMGEIFDKDSGMLHSAHEAVNAIFILYQDIKEHIGKDKLMEHLTLRLREAREKHGK